MAHWRTEHSKQLVQVGLLDYRIDLLEGTVQDWAAAVVKLVKSQICQQHKAERAAIFREATRPISPPGPNQALPGTLLGQQLLLPKLGQAEGCPAQHQATQLPPAALWDQGLWGQSPR